MTDQQQAADTYPASAVIPTSLSPRNNRLLHSSMLDESSLVVEADDFIDLVAIESEWERGDVAPLRPVLRGRAIATWIR